MENMLNVEQRAAIGSNTTQIGEQTNYYGISPEKAAAITIDLFMTNFPKLTEIAKEVAEKRMHEFCEQIFQKMKNEKVDNYNAFSDPDMQFILYEAQKDYARIGTKELLDVLSNLITQRVKADDDFIFKMLLDKAIAVAKYLLPGHLDFLSVIFWGKHSQFREISNLNDLHDLLCFHISFLEEAIIDSTGYLDNNGCLRLFLGKTCGIISKRYGFNKIDVDNVIPKIMKSIPGDYGLSPLGLVLAIININCKEKTNIDIKKWL